MATSIDLTIPVAGATLAGTLTLLAAATGPVPAVLLLPGSGPVDRDSNVRSMRLDVTRHLAQALAGAGIASLRYDKRGVGASVGGDWRAVGLWDLVRDAQAALAALAQRPEIDGARVAVAGHSEGALIATHLAARADGLRAAVLLAGSARPGEDLLLWQAGNLAPSMPAPVRGLLRLLRVDLVARVAKNHARVKATTADIVRLGGVRTNARWFREFMAYDPRADLAAITRPLLAITGAKDLQADPRDLDLIAEIVPGPVTVERPGEVTHTLRAQPRPASLRRYKEEISRPVDGQVTATVVRWTADALSS